MSPLLTGFAFGGAAGLPKATYTATTGSPTIDTSSRPGKTIIKYTGSGSITIGTAGTCEVLVIGGGASGGAYAGGGAGGVNYSTSAILPAGVLNVTVGAGGPAQSFSYTNVPNNGVTSSVGNYLGLGGGGINASISGPIPGYPGGSGSGAAGTGNSLTNTIYGGVALISGQGNNGGTSQNSSGGLTNGGGGGGAGGAGGAGSSTTPSGGSGGPGISNSITGSAITYAGGGGGCSSISGNYGSGGSGGGGAGASSNAVSGNPGTANLGAGGGANQGQYSSGAGGSGYVVIVLG